MATLRPPEADDAPAPVSGYAQAVEVTGVTRWLYVSGQIPVTRDGGVPADFSAQARLVWANIEAQLRAADMGLDDLVKVTIYLASRDDRIANRAVRDEVLAGRKVALTLVIVGIFDEAWLIEIEAVAAQ